MIDIDKVENKFQEYVFKFNSKQGRIKLKIDHIKKSCRNKRNVG